MTKDQAIEVLIAHAKRCPEPEPPKLGERLAKVDEAVGVLTSQPSMAGASFALHLEHASALVRSWPEWKQQVLGSTATAPPPNAEHSPAPTPPKTRTRPCYVCEGLGSRASDEAYMMMHTEPCTTCKGTGKLDMLGRAVTVKTP